MAQIAHICFPAAKQVIDRFHVQKLAFEAVQEMRIKARWEALDKETVEIAYAKASGQPFIAEIFSNGGSCKQLLARSRYLLFKKESLWSEASRKGPKYFFREYPQIKKAYYLSMGLGLIFQQAHTADVALTRLAHWYDRVDRSGFLPFGTIARTIQSHYINIVNFFHRRAINAAAESFNAKIKAFRSRLRGVRDIAFFLFRLANIYA